MQQHWQARKFDGVHQIMCTGSRHSRHARPPFRRTPGRKDFCSRIFVVLQWRRRCCLNSKSQLTPPTRFVLFNHGHVSGAVSIFFLAIRCFDQQLNAVYQISLRWFDKCLFPIAFHSTPPTPSASFVASPLSSACCAAASSRTRNRSLTRMPLTSSRSNIAPPEVTTRPPRR
jgi:hypothetical protein